MKRVPSSAKRNGFTIIELVTVVGIIGLLAGLLLPAVQSAREAARRTQCTSHLRNQVLAVLDFEQAFYRLPPGRAGKEKKDFAWSFYILPMLEQQNVANQIDRERAAYDPINERPARTILPIYRCPSSIHRRPGDIDYAGITGTVMGYQGEAPFNRGALIFALDDELGVPLSSVTDGVSNTICISECADREPPDGLWINGINVISHDAGKINEHNDRIYSRHVGGAFAAFLDGAVHFLTSDIDETILAALLTRNGGESVNFFH